MDQVLDQILFAYRCSIHTSTHVTPYTLLYNRDPPLPVPKLIKCIGPYKGEIHLGRGLNNQESLSMAAKILERMRANQKRHYHHQRATHKFQVGDLILLKKHNADKMDLIWEPNYRVVGLTSPWSAIVENHMGGKTKRCNVGDLKPKHHSEDWELKASPIGRAVRFINHPDKLPDIDITPDCDQPLTVPHDQKDNKGTRYNLRMSIKSPTQLDL